MGGLTAFRLDGLWTTFSAERVDCGDDTSASRAMAGRGGVGVCGPFRTGDWRSDAGSGKQRLDELGAARGCALDHDWGEVECAGWSGAAWDERDVSRGGGEWMHDWA
jgi:hypothetical protein